MHQDSRYMEQESGDWGKGMLYVSGMKVLM